MGNLEPFDFKRTNWEGLWYHPENRCFTSSSFSLAELRKFKGSVRLIVRKNRFYCDGTNNRPNYVFMLVDSKSDKYIYLDVVDDDDNDEDDLFS